MKSNSRDLKELFYKVQCALFHDKEACNKCKKCGKDAVEARSNIADDIKDALYIDTEEE